MALAYFRWRPGGAHLQRQCGRQLHPIEDLSRVGARNPLAFASIIMISGFTAAIASSLTVGELGQTIAGVDDLYGRRVLTVPGSTSAAFLDRKLIRHQTVATMAEALDALAAGQADAVVYDVPILRYLVNAQHAADLRVLPNLLAHQDYGIALPADAPIRKALNRRILRIIQGPEWGRLLEGYLGPEG